MREPVQSRPQGRLAAGIAAAGLVIGLAGVGWTGQDSISGRGLFARHCAPCHTSDGKPKGHGVPDLSSRAVQARLSMQRLKEVILNGTLHMPGNKKQLTTIQVSHLAAYVRTLAP